MYIEKLVEEEKLRLEGVVSQFDQKNHGIEISQWTCVIQIEPGVEREAGTTKFKREIGLVAV